MTLKVGYSYRGMWAGFPETLTITKIVQKKDGVWVVFFRTGRFLDLFTAKRDAVRFVERLDQATDWDAAQAADAERSSIIKEVKELEVKYK